MFFFSVDFFSFHNIFILESIGVVQHYKKTRRNETEKFFFKQRSNKNLQNTKILFFKFKFKITI